MNILHICNNFISSTVHQRMAQASRKLGLRNTVFAPVVTLEGRVKPIEDEHAVACVNSLDRFFFHHKQKKTYNALKKAVDVSDYDYLHTHCVFTDGNVAMRLKKELGLPYLVTINNTDLNHFFKLRVLLRKRGVRIMQEADAIVFIAEPYRKAVFERYIPQKLHAELLGKTHIIPFGMDDFWFEHLAQPKQLSEDKKLHLFYAGDINANKNITLTVEAIRLLRQQGWNITLSLAGKVHDEALLASLTAESFVCYLGLMDREGLLEQYRQADIFAMPSHRDTFGLVYAEAMSQGTPVLYTRGQGFDEQFPDGTVGYAVSDCDPEEMADRILRIAENYHALSAACIRNTDKFNWENIAKQYRSIYIETEK